MEQLFIEPISTKLLEDLHRISVHTFRSNYGHLNTPENLQQHIDQHLSKERLKTELEHPEMRFFFAWVDGKIVGYSKLNFGQGQTEDYGEDQLEIERIYVLEEYQGNGYGGALIQHAEQQAKALGKSIIWLGVWEKNPRAIAFYEHIGFRKIGKHTFQVGQDPQTDWVMRLSL